MIGMSTWAFEEPASGGSPGTATGAAGMYRNRLGAVLPGGRGTAPEISLQFSMGVMHVAVRTATDPSLDKLVGTVGKRLKRAGYSCQAPYPTQFGGFADARGMVAVKKKKGRQPAGESVVQLYGMAGPYSVGLTVPEAQAGLVGSFGPITIGQVHPPAIVPIVRMGVPNVAAVGEKVILTEKQAKLTAMITRDPVTMSTEQFADSCLQGIMGRLRGAEVNEGQPDMFLGGQYCMRRTFVIGGVSHRTAVRSEYWWAGVVAGYGVQIFVAGTKSIIDLNHAGGLKDAVVLIPPD
jgi:hypothetical protein